MNKDFKKPFSIPVSLETTKDFSTLLTYKEDSKYKPVIAVKAKDSNPRIILQTNTNYYKEIVDFLVAIGEPVVRTKNFHEYELNKFSLYSASSMGFETDDTNARKYIKECFTKRFKRFHRRKYKDIWNGQDYIKR